MKRRAWTVNVSCSRIAGRISLSAAESASHVANEIISYFHDWQVKLPVMSALFGLEAMQAEKAVKQAIGRD